MKTVLTGGKFNRVHPGHVWLLKKAKSMGGRLIVVLANDKNNKRPYALPAARRKKMLAATKIPDKIVTGDPHDHSKVIDRYKPSIIVLGYDQRLPPRTAVKVRKMRIKIIRMKKHGSYSTDDYV